MDIRIGNDICVQIPVSEFGPIDPDDIREIRCTFINQQNTWPHDYKFHPAFHCSTQYTIRSCGHYSYNVHPHNIHMYCMDNDPHCGSVVCRDKFFQNKLESYCNVSNGYINAYFPAEFQRTLGSYKCVFEVKVLEEGWDCDDIHTYTASYDHVFNLKKNGIQGRTIIINPVDEKKYDTYICSITEEELQKYKGDYTKLIPVSEGFKFSNLPGFKKNITIGDENKKIVIISKYNSLQFKLDSYSIPMNMIKQDDDHYVYISKDSYSNRLMSIQIVNQQQSNPEYVEPVRTLKDKSDWLIVVQPSVNPDTVDHFGATVFLEGTVKRTIVYEWSDGRPNDTEEEEIVLQWNYISSDGRYGDVIGSQFSVGSNNNKQRTFTFIGRTNSELGDNYTTDGFTVTQTSQSYEPEQPEDPIETGITYGTWSANTDCKATPSEIDTIGGSVALSGSASRVNVRHFSDGSSENTTETTQLLWKYINNNGSEFDVEEGHYSIGVWTDDNSEHKLRHYFTGYTSNPNGTNATFENLVYVTQIRHNYIDHISDITLSNSNRYEGSINLSIHGSFTGFNPVSSTCEEVKVENGVLKFVVPENEDNFAKEHTIRLHCFPDGYSISFKITQPGKVEEIIPAIYGTINFTETPLDLAESIKNAIINNTTASKTSVNEVLSHTLTHGNIYEITLAKGNRRACAFFLLPNISKYNGKKMVHCGGNDLGDETVTSSGGIKNIDGSVITVNNQEYRCYAFLYNATLDNIEFNFGMI